MALFLNRLVLIGSYFRKILSDITILTAPPTLWPCTPTGSQQGKEGKIPFEGVSQIFFREQREALDDWLAWVSSKDDVYFVTGTQTLLLMTDPTPVSKLANFEPWQCEKKPVDNRVLPLKNTFDNPLYFRSHQSHASPLTSAHWPTRRVTSTW